MRNPQKDEQALSKFCELVETTIDLDTLFDKDYKIKPDFDPSLSEISNNMESAFKAINDLYLEAGDDLNLDTASNKLKLEQHQTHGWCMRVTRNDSRVLRGKSQYKELQTVKSGVSLPPWNEETFTRVHQGLRRVQRQAIRSYQRNLVAYIDI